MCKIFVLDISPNFYICIVRSSILVEPEIVRDGRETSFPSLGVDSGFGDGGRKGQGGPQPYKNKQIEIMIAMIMIYVYIYTSTYIYIYIYCLLFLVFGNTLL